MRKIGERKEGEEGSLHPLLLTHFSFFSFSHIPFSSSDDACRRLGWNSSDYHPFKYSTPYSQRGEPLLYDDTLAECMLFEGEKVWFEFSGSNNNSGSDNVGELDKAVTSDNNNDSSNNSNSSGSYAFTSSSSSHHSTLSSSVNSLHGIRFSGNDSSNDNNGIKLSFSDTLADRYGFGSGSSSSSNE